MSWIVKRIQEDDYGCEERTEDSKVKVLVTLVDENGQERLVRVEDDWLYAHGIDEGDKWPTIVRIRSGGQSGVDRAALDFARKQNIEICGWCPKGGWAEDYTEAPGILAVYPELQETPEAEPWQRTLWNMRDAQAILTIMPEGAGESKGTELGVREGAELGKPMFTARGVEDAAEIAAWLRALAEDGANGVTGANGANWSFCANGANGFGAVSGAVGIELCVGGPRASECPEAYRVTMEILEKVMEFTE